MNDEDFDRLTAERDANVVPFPIDPHSRLHNEAEAELDQLAVRRKRPTLTGCRHDASWVDIDARRVYCRRCEAELDPFDVLEKLARNREFLVTQGRTLRFECDRRARELEDLKRREANAKARVRRPRASSKHRGPTPDDRPRGRPVRGDIMTAPIEVIADEAEKRGMKLDPKSLLIGFTIRREFDHLRTEKELRRHVASYDHGRARERTEEIVQGLA
jgi:hypothetical protein